MSYDEDPIKAKDGWWVVIKNLPSDKDFPDPNQPHPFTDAFKKMDKLMANSYCYKLEELLMNINSSRKEFYDVTNSDDITKILQYWAALFLKAKEDKDAGKGLTWGPCFLGVMRNVPTVKQYVAAYFSARLNLKYSLTVLAIEGVHKKIHRRGAHQAV